MKHRIKELADKCWSHRIDGTLIDGHLHFDYEKFAKLVVADCVKIIEGYCETSPEIYGLPLDILDHFDMEIKDE